MVVVVAVQTADLPLHQVQEGGGGGGPGCKGPDCGGGPPDTGSGGGPDDPDPTSTEPSSSSSESCTNTVTATYQSVFCTVTTSSTTVTTNTPISDIPGGTILPRDQGCSTLAYSTVLKCSATGTTATSSVTASATVYVQKSPCSPKNCGLACAAKPPDENKPPPEDIQVPGKNESLPIRARGDVSAAPTRARDPPDGQLATPEYCYWGDAGRFMRGEVARAFSMGNYVYISDSQTTTSQAIRFGNRVTELAVESLYGCMAVIVASERGCLIFHIFEEPTFTGYDWTNFRYIPADEARFQENVVQALRYKDHSQTGFMAGILNLRTDSQSYTPIPWLDHWSDMFNNDANPHVGDSPGLPPPPPPPTYNPA